jgi:hypothetical protein
MDDFDADFDMSLPSDEGAPLPLCIGSEKQPREVLEPHLSGGYDGALACDPCVLLRGFIGPAAVVRCTPAVAKEAWAMANVIADRIELNCASTAALQAELDEARARIAVLEGAIERTLAHRYGDWCPILRQALAGKETP